jgi:hypothetical protein
MRPSGAGLAGLVRGARAFDVRFARCGRFPGVLYLVADPDAPLRIEADVGPGLSWAPASRRSP